MFSCKILKGCHTDNYFNYYVLQDFILKITEFEEVYTQDFQCVAKYYDRTSGTTKKDTIVDVFKNSKGLMQVKLAGYVTLVPVRDLLSVEVTNKTWDFPE